MGIQQFDYPTTMLYGPGAVAEMARRLADAHRDDPLLLISDPALVDIGMVREIVDHLRTWGLSVTDYSGVHGNPMEADVLAGVDAFRSSGAKGMIALGGGSAMDMAKGVAVLATQEGPLSRFDHATGGEHDITGPLPPVYAVPTTAGTGSEVSRSCLIVCADTEVKTVIWHPGLMPRLAVLDPELSVALPPLLTATTGMGAFAHALEAYLARGFHPIADAIALGSMELCVEYLPRALAHGDDVDTRGRMLLAASMGAIASQKGLGMIHSMARALATHYDMHDGLANALLMPKALAWQLANKADAFTDDLRARYARVAGLVPGPVPGLVDERTADDLPEALTRLCASVGIEGTLSDSGLAEDDIPALSDEAIEDACHRDNPIVITREDFAAVFHSCL